MGLHNVSGVKYREEGRKQLTRKTWDKPANFVKKNETFSLLISSFLSVVTALDFLLRRFASLSPSFSEGTESSTSLKMKKNPIMRDRNHLHHSLQHVDAKRIGFREQVKGL